MVIKKATYKTKLVKQRVMVTNDVHGCDACKKQIKEYPNEANRLTLDVWPNKGGECKVEHYHFCSWRCLLKFIPKIKSTYFASMPYLHFDEGGGNRTVKELISIIEPLKL